MTPREIEEALMLSRLVKMVVLWELYGGCRRCLRPGEKLVEYVVEEPGLWWRN